MTANEYVYNGASHSFRGLLDSLVAYAEQGTLPCTGGWFDQPAAWADAWATFRAARGYWENERGRLTNRLRELGAYGKQRKD